MTTMEELSSELRTFVNLYKWQRIDPVPFATMRRPLREARIGLVVTACMTMPEQEPFDANQPDNDPSIRVVPAQTDPQVLVNTYAEQAFDHAGLAEDANLLVPIDRIREMAEGGEIGELSPRVVSLCGHLPHPKVLMRDTAPAIARLFLDDGVDVAMLVPA